MKIKLRNYKCLSARCMLNIITKLIFISIVACFCLELTSCNYFQSNAAKLKKAKILYKDNKFNHSIFVLKRVLQSESSNCDARLLLAENLFAKFSLIDAKSTIEGAIEHSCKSPKFYYLLAKIDIYRNRLADAENLFSGKIGSKLADSAKGNLALGDISFVKGDYNKAKYYFSKYYTLSNDSVFNCIDTTKLLLIKKDYHAAENNSKICEEKYSSKTDFDLDQSRFLHALALLHTDNNTDAGTILHNIINNYKNPKDPNFKIQSSLLLMRVYLQHKDIMNARKMADIMLNYVATPETYFVKGLAAEQDNHFGLAEQQFLAGLKLNSNDEQLLLELSNLKFKEGDIEQAKYYAGKVDALTGNNLYTDQLNGALAMQYLKAGNLDAIINKLPHNNDKNSLKSQFILSLAYAEKGEVKKAWNVFAEIGKYINDNTKKDILKARLYLALDDTRNAEKIYKKYVRKGLPSAIVGITQIYISKHKYDAAEKLLLNNIHRGIDKKYSSTLLANLYDITKQKDKLFSFLQQNIKKHPGDNGYILLLARMYYQYGMYDKAEHQASLLIASTPNLLEAYTIKANSYLKQNDIQNAKNIYKIMIQRDDKNSDAYLMLGLLDSKQGHPNKALINLNNALKIDPRFLKAIYEKISILAQQKKKKNAIEFAKSSAELFDRMQIKYALLGFVHLQLSQDKNAYYDYKKALATSNNNPELAIQVYKLSKKIYGFKYANSELSAYANKTKNAASLFYVANYYMNQKEFYLAKKYYQYGLNVNDRNAIALNNLAWLELQMRNIESAYNYASKAVLLAPDSAAVMDTMGQVLLQKHSYADAGVYLRKANQFDDDNPSIMFHLAQYYYHVGRYVEAKQLLIKIHDIKFLQAPDANKLLSKING